MAIIGYPNGYTDPFGNYVPTEDDGGFFDDTPPGGDDTGPSEPYLPPPEDVREKQGEDSLRGRGVIIFPLTLRQERSYFELIIEKEVRAQVTDPTIIDIIQTIVLPVPVNLSEQFQMNYNSIEIGAILGDADVRKAAESVVQGLANPGTADKKELTKNVGESVEKIKKSAVPYAIRTAAKALDAGLGAIADQINGGIPNPNLALLYQGHGFRSFQFSWKLVPRNVRESRELAELIRIIKFVMHPGRRDGTIFLDFPYKVSPTIVINNIRKFFPIKKSVITNFSVNFAPSSIPAFYKNELTPSPIEVDISLSLQETEIFLRGDFAPESGGV